MLKKAKGFRDPGTGIRDKTKGKKGARKAEERNRGCTLPDENNSLLWGSLP
ncbi:hypothetical protein [Candidatus Formimonas warabiya]|uniref:hypothetical protein n=1 Tax=Formimonas warabiya TaxID=1761012 RepID=UPI001BE3F9E5|nr:hypothetical protein [Candidatus Formimonas warabiya]